MQALEFLNNYYFLPGVTLPAISILHSWHSIVGYLLNKFEVFCANLIGISGFSQMASQSLYDQYQIAQHYRSFRKMTVAEKHPKHVKQNT